jgi:predicted ester cyclase
MVSPGATLSPEDKKEIVRRATEEFINRADEAAADEVFTSSYIEHAHPGVGNLAEFKVYMRGLRNSLGNFSIEIQAVLVDGDYVIHRALLKGTHQDTLFGLPPTGRKVAVEVIDIFRLEGGKIAEHWGQADTPGLLQQIGIAPPPHASGKEVMKVMLGNFRLFGGLPFRKLAKKLRGRR